MMMPSVFGENLFADFMNFPFEKDLLDMGERNELFGRHNKNIMKTDVKETENSYNLDVDLPGLKKEEINAKLENGYLTISVSKGYDKSKKNEDGKYIRRERYSGQCARSFYVGENIRQEEIKAKYEDGILKLQIPKKSTQNIEHNKYILIE